ncbi:hypothetical protein [Rhodococcus sp. BS-15]|uniref:hypothetical protein n=1 Tax=Rhodococcus sp. BS-15 TaxID=1304954 RepID=UPI000AC0A973|nr:hypothetical protein [Rhodococcus sp. BS-15]
MIDHDASSPVPPRTLTWVRRHLGVGERITEIEQMSGGSTAEVRKLTVVAWAQLGAKPDGRT